MSAAQPGRRRTSEVPITEVDAALGAEVERRVGRNLLLYQRIENGLKRMLLQSCVEGKTLADIEQRLAVRAAKIMRMNMGVVAGAVFEQVLTDDPQPPPEPDSSAEAVIRARFTIGSHPDSPDSIIDLRARCKAVVDARNDLVHHFLRQTHLESVDRLRVALDALDAQHDEALTVRDELRAHLQSMAETQRQSATFLASEEGQQALELAMAEGRLLDVLADVAQVKVRSDGWTLLTTALHRARAAVPADVERLRSQFGPRWIQQVLGRYGTQFELAQEATPNASAGSTRPIYRIRT